MNQPLPRFSPKEVIGFTAAEFLRMSEAGAFDDMKVELIGGEIQRMNPPMNEHSERQAAVVILLASVFASNRIRGELAIRLDAETVVGCDAAVLREPATGHRPIEPDELLLTIEIAETTINRDLGPKRHLYAGSGVPHYWVLDGARRVTHVFGRPEEGDYASVAVIPFGQPLPVPGTDATITL